MDYQTINSTIRKGTKGCNADLKKQMRSLNMKHVKSATNTQPLSNIANKFKSRNGLINRIGFKFKQSGVFVHKGVGRGTPAALAGLTKRKPKEWLNPVIEKFADELTESVADQHLQIVADKLKIK